MIYALIALLIWSSSFVAGKISYSVADPVLIAQIRFILAGIMVFPFFLQAYRKVPMHLRRRIWFLAILNFPISFLLQFIGLNYTSAASAATVVGTEPLLTVLIGYLFFKQSAKLLDWLMGALAFVGIAIIVYSTHQTEGEIGLLGLFLVLAAAVSFVFCLYLGKNLMKEIEPKVYTTVTLGLAPWVCIPFTLLLTQNWAITPNTPGILAILYLGFACSWLAMVLWNKSIHRIHANTAGILISLEPVFGVLMAVLILGERLSFLTFVGVILVIVATFVAVGLPVVRQHLKSKKIKG
ncbi:DMT family transporter [Conservatibacter flavescens]|uniref:EamA family transporter n=1 Tax=Conservatibacter flavescens TaxID=28161 RepID=A0A2M8S1X3_9PAST|nr:EamA family transporter [Conservatibacter flavescens]PJG85125.1 EamA family transporter [Conservatibacter flavescens]